MFQRQSGFTLVELLITISIIAILSAISLTVLSEVNKNGRDAKRISDLKTVQSALEQYYADQGFYPTEDAMNTALANVSSFTNAIGAPGVTTASKTYLNNLPKDTSSSVGTYTYKSFKSNDAIHPESCDNTTSKKCSFYCFYASVENESTQCNPENRGNFPTSCTGTNNVSALCGSPRLPTGYNFILTPP